MSRLPIKKILVMVIMLLVGVLGVFGVQTAKVYLGGATADDEPKNVSATVRTGGGEAKVEYQADIKWQTDKSVMQGGRIEYGTMPASLLLREKFAETEPSTSHLVTLSSLRATGGGTNYYFRIVITQADGSEEVYDNGGIPYSFRVKPEGVSVSVTPVTSPKPTAMASPAACDPKKDNNGDGQVNSLDMLACRQQAGASPTARFSPTAVPSGAKCDNPGDFDGNGTINSLDRLKCLQAAK